MYNRYIPEGASYTPVEREPRQSPPVKEPSRPGPRPQRPAGSSGGQGRPKPGRQPLFRPGGFRIPFSLAGGDGLSALLKAVHLDGMDSGDLLLLLILLYLMTEGDDLEPVIALGLVLAMGFFDGEEQGEQAPPPCT